MIIIINGPLGIGKTQTSWELMKRYNCSAMIDLDYVFAVYPFEYGSEKYIMQKLETIVLLINQYNKYGVKNYIINGVFHSPDELTRMLSFIPLSYKPIIIFRLDCDWEIIKNRIIRRNLADLDLEINRSKYTHKIMRDNFSNWDCEYVIDSTKLNIPKVVEEMWLAEHKIQLSGKSRAR